MPSKYFFKILHISRFSSSMIFRFQEWALYYNCIAQYCFCSLPSFLPIQHGCAFMKHDFPLPLQQIWNVFWEMLKHPFEHKESLGEDKGARGSEENLPPPGGGFRSRVAPTPFCSSLHHHWQVGDLCINNISHSKRELRLFCGIFWM